MSSSGPTLDVYLHVIKGGYAVLSRHVGHAEGGQAWLPRGRLPEDLAPVAVVKHLGGKRGWGERGRGTEGGASAGASACVCLAADAGVAATH